MNYILSNIVITVDLAPLTRWPGTESFRRKPAAVEFYRFFRVNLWFQYCWRHFDSVRHSMRFNLSEIIRLPSSTANLCNSKLQHRRCASAKPLKMQMQIESVRDALHTWRRELVPLLCIFIALFCFSFRRYLLANLPITRCVRLNSSHWCWRLLNYIWIFVVVAKTQRLAEYPSIGCISRTYLTHTIGSSFALASLAILAICSQSPWLIDELEQCALCTSRQCRHSIHFIVYFNSKRR